MPEKENNDEIMELVGSSTTGFDDIVKIKGKNINRSFKDLKAVKIEKISPDNDGVDALNYKIKVSLSFT